MPYVKQEVRHDMANGKPAMTAGDLNYAVTLEILDLVKKNGDPNAFTKRIRALVDQYWTASYRKQNYQTINDIGGALIHATMEFATRVRDKLPLDLALAVSALVADVHGAWYDEVAVPYEKTKIAENGDVYPESFVPGGDA